MNSKLPTYKKIAYGLTIFLTMLALGCVVWIFFIVPNQIPSGQYVAQIYQNGKLIQSIPLDSVETTYRFTVTGENGCHNEIEVCPGSIGIISADCPDKLCVKQGFIRSSLLPITCLPNHLVIQIRAKNTVAESDTTVDIITY